jgi:exonuclease SbcC
MRPIKLTMTAFGPYAGSEIVDFRNAIASGLFGIYGSTGSGKSTIFSAMTFALFGEPSRSEQDAISLRSDHAAADVLTQVELIFEVGKTRYLIRRTPDQMRPALRGEGETKDAHKAWLFDVTGIDPDDISEENAGKVIAEKKVGLVKEAVLDRLGYGAEQFRQIVLLPQGKFETFLTAKTDERMKTLRDLFDVTLYRKLAQTLKEQAKAAEETVIIDRKTCASRLQQDGFESPDALKAGISDAKAAEAGSKKQADVADKGATLAGAALNTARQVEAAFVAEAEAQSVLQALTDKAAEIEAADTTLKNAIKVQSLMDVDAAIKAAKAAVTKAEHDLTTAKTAHKTAANNKEKAAGKLKAQEALSKKRDDQRGTVDTLTRHTEILTKAKTLKTDCLDAQTKESKAKADFEAAETALQQTQAKQTATQADAKTAQSQNLDRSQITATLTKAQQSLAAAKNRADTQRSVSEATALVARAMADHAETKRELAGAEVHFETSETALAATQAQHLAEKLEDGQPCAVCGSTSHPAPAMGSAESAGLDQAFREARKQLEAKRAAHAKAANTLSGIEARVEDRKATFAKLPAPDQTLEAAQQAVNGLQGRLKSLGPVRNIAEIEATFPKLEQAVAGAQAQVTQARNLHETAKTESALTKQAYDAALGTVPEVLRENSALSAALQTAQAAYQSMLDALKAAQDQATATREAALSSAKDLEGAQKVLTAAQSHRKTAEETFAARLQQQGLTLEQYETRKADIDQIKSLTTNIAAYKEALAIAKYRLKTTSAAIKDKTRPDLEALAHLSQEAEAARETKASKAAALKARTDQLETLLTSISAELARIEKVEQDTAALRELAALFNADNTAKLDLETFAIGAMFDHVLQAANLRLQPMTIGRYSLERELDGKGGGRRGLGISVYDIHTGKARATSTLSGGETFIAALALALGLSDTVESTSGNIRLDTIFIDEGFGSLDTDNDTGTLDQVLQTLQDLVGDNRAVGLISHVPLVQQAIPNGFAIKKTPTGSHVEIQEF